MVTWRDSKGDRLYPEIGELGLSPTLTILLWSTLKKFAFFAGKRSIKVRW